MRAMWLGLALVAQPAGAKVVESGPAGFTSEHRATLAMPPAEAWARLVAVGSWWDGAHSYSGAAANLTLEPRAGGCWCEALADGGSVEHMRVAMAMPGKLLRLTGGLGPLQERPVAAVLTFTLAAKATGTEIVATYRVGGAGLEALAAPVDGVLGHQVARLAMARP